MMKILGVFVSALIVMAIMLACDLTVYWTSGLERQGERLLMFIILCGSVSRFINSKV